jgi:hypothetical protein
MSITQCQLRRIKQDQYTVIFADDLTGDLAATSDTIGTGLRTESKPSRANTTKLT